MNVMLPKSSKGLSLVEALVLLAVLAVLVAFADPMFRDNSARSAIKEATVQVALALHKARNSARASNTRVTVLFSTNPSNNTISFEFPDSGAGDNAGDNAGDGAHGSTAPPPTAVTLPDSIAVSSDTPALIFNPQGTANTGGFIVLTSGSDTDFYATVVLKSPSGRVKTSYGLQGQDGDTDAS